MSKDIVEDKLKGSVLPRNSNIFLILSVWKDQGLDVDLKSLKDLSLSSPESLTRARRHFQNDLGLYLATEEVRAKRACKEVMYKNEYRRKEDDIPYLEDIL
jgi:hypothetical protein